ncbi:MAG: hypothetical protein LLF83_09230 [Methanobacterium sp.]|nr:hypothetical protein [Methanobacterium sp.]
MEGKSKPWFGKKAVGWGPAPKTWQGWLITILMVAIVILGFALFRFSIYSVIIFILDVTVFLIIASANSEKPETKES